MSRLTISRLTLITLLALVASWVSAQRMPSPGPGFTRLHPTSPALGPGAGPGFGTFPNQRSFFYPGAFFADPFFADDVYSAGYPVSSQSPVIVMQPAPAATLPEPVPSPAEPLVIELQGDRYVRVSGAEPSGSEMIDRSSSTPQQIERSSAAVNHTAASRDLPAVVLVFRDRHHEEVSDYVISDGVLYARADYYSGGSWSKKIELTSLDLPETLDLNRSRGVGFRLPSAPNEVITRP